MSKPHIFLDYNATTPILPSALEALSAAYALPLNPSSIHYFGREGKKLLQNSRASIANSIDADGAEIIFTGTGTEANNLVITGLHLSKKLIVSSIEHPSILKPAEGKGAELVKANSDGTINLNHLEELLQKHADFRPLVSIMYANNETGVIQPITEIADIIFKYNGYFHCDASQAAGKLPLSFHNSRADLMTISAHKLGGAKGAAALIVKKGIHLNAQIVGGGQEKGYRAGTENLPAIASFAAALAEITKRISKTNDQIPSNLVDIDSQSQKPLQNTLQNYSTSLDFWSEKIKYHVENELKKIAPESVIFGEKAAHRLPNTICVATPNITSETQLINYDLAGISLSSGSACSSGRVNVSHVLLAMGVDPELAKCAVRVSLGWLNTTEDANRFLEVFAKNFERSTRR